MGLDTLQGRRDKNKLKWWYKLAALPGNRYQKKLYNQEWNFKPPRGRQRKYWSKVIDDLFSSLGLEWLHDIQNGDCSLKGFLSIVGDRINEREIRKFEKGQLLLYKAFNKVVEFKKYLHGKSDAGSRLMFKLVRCLTLLRDVWELRKVRLYGDNHSVQQSQSQNVSGELQGVAWRKG